MLAVNVCLRVFRPSLEKDPTQPQKEGEYGLWGMILRKTKVFRQICADPQFF
jgi:hypothetical protein